MTSTVIAIHRSPCGHSLLSEDYHGERRPVPPESERIAWLRSFDPRYSRIPDYVLESLIDYVDYGLPPGHFLTAMLENDLSHAVGNADTRSLSFFFDLAYLIFNRIPSLSWGSEQKVDNWVSARQEVRAANMIAQRKLEAEAEAATVATSAAMPQPPPVAPAPSGAEQEQ